MMNDRDTYMTVTSVDNYSKIQNQSSDELYQSNKSPSFTSNFEDVEKTLPQKSATHNGFQLESRGDKIRFGILMVGTLFAMFMMSLNSTVVAPAVTIIATDLNAVSSQTWIATAYLVAVNAFQPLSGKVSKQR